MAARRMFFIREDSRTVRRLQRRPIPGFVTRWTQGQVTPEPTENPAYLTSQRGVQNYMDRERSITASFFQRNRSYWRSCADTWADDDVQDTDLSAELYEILPDGNSVELTARR